MRQDVWAFGIQGTCKLGIRYLFTAIWVFGTSFVSLQLVVNKKRTRKCAIFALNGLDTNLFGTLANENLQASVVRVSHRETSRKRLAKTVFQKTCSKQNNNKTTENIFFDSFRLTLPGNASFPGIRKIISQPILCPCTNFRFFLQFSVFLI